jgi:hypothetical protein
VEVKVSIKLKKPCSSLSASDRAGIAANFCKESIAAAGMDPSEVQCKASVTCDSSKRRSLQQNGSSASLKADFKVVTTSSDAISSNNAAASSLASVAEAEGAKIVEEIIPGAKASMDKVSTTKGSKPTKTGTSSCSISGKYAIRPLYSPCSKRYLTYSYKPGCKSKSKSIKLRSTKQIKRGKTSLDWQLDGTRSVSIVGSELKECKYRTLAASSPGKNMKLGGSNWKWSVVPRTAGDCSKVRLYSSKRKGYLALSKNCKKFSYSKSTEDKGTLWRLVKR